MLWYRKYNAEDRNIFHLRAWRIYLEQLKLFRFGIHMALQVVTSRTEKQN